MDREFDSQHLLVQVALTDEYEHSPIVTAQNTLTLLQKRTGIGTVCGAGSRESERLLSRLGAQVGY